MASTVTCDCAWPRGARISLPAAVLALAGRASVRAARCISVGDMPLSVVALEAAACQSDATFQRAQNKKLLNKARAEAIAILKKDDDQVTLCLQALRNKQFSQKAASQSTTADPDDVPWPATYTQHWRVGKAWIASWMLQQDSGVVAQTLVTVDTAYPEDGLRRLLEFLTGVKKNDHFPKPLQCKTLASRYYTHKYKFLGSRLEKLHTDGAFGSDGRIAYEVYRLVPLDSDKNIVGAIAHIQGQRVEIPPEQRFSMEAVIHNNWNDMEAFVQHGIVRFNCHELFSDAKMDKNFCTKEACVALAEQLKKQHLRQAEQVTTGKIAMDKEVDIIRPEKRKAAKVKEAKEAKKLALTNGMPSGSPAPLTLGAVVPKSDANEKNEGD